MIFTEAIKQASKAKRLSKIGKITETNERVIIEMTVGKEGKEKASFEVSDNYFKVIAEKGEKAADIILYGVIGQDFWWDEKLDEESITDLSFTRTLRSLEKDYSRINIRINSPGGSVYHGDPIITAIRNSPAEIHTYNDGTCGSMAFDIWLAGNVRHMSINAKLMCHATSSYQFGTAADMKEAATRLEVFDTAAIKTFAHVSNLSEDEVREKFYNDYKDHWLGAEEAKELGLISEIENYEVQDTSNDIKLGEDEVIKSVTTLNIIEGKEELTNEEMINKLEEAYGKKITFVDTETVDDEKAIITKVPEEIIDELEMELREAQNGVENEGGLSLDLASRIIDLHD